jgi:magnesium chelatase subunit I
MTYPFTAIVGQEEMKLALVLNLVDPLIGGVLIMGHRGTGKSTAVRGLAGLLPPIAVVDGCPYNCDPAAPCDECRQKKQRTTKSIPVPVVELPLGATEDRVCGTIDIERALASGRKVFDPGLLARANRGFI